MKCSNCGNKVNETAEQCPHCGAVFEGASSGAGEIPVDERYLRGLITAIGILGVLSPLMIYFLIMSEPGRANVHLPIMLIFIGLWGGTAAAAGLDVDWYLPFAGAVFGIAGAIMWFFILVRTFGIQLESQSFFQLWFYEPVIPLIVGNAPEFWFELSNSIEPLLGLLYLGLAVLCLAAAFGK